MLLDGIVIFEKLEDKLTVLFSLKAQLVSLLLDLDDPLSLGEKSCLKLLLCPLKLCLLLLPLF
jgi:hypothetical protein